MTDQQHAGTQDKGAFCFQLFLEEFCFSEMYESGQFRLCLCISTVYFGLKNGQSLQDKKKCLKDIAAFSALSASPKAPI